MRWMVFLLAATALAGCAGESDDAGDMDHGDHAGHAMHMMQNVTFFEDTTDITETFSGAFEPTDHPALQGVLATAGQPTTTTRTFDVADLLPRDVPAYVELAVDAAPGIYIFLATDDFASIWTSDCGACEGGAAQIGTTWSGAVRNTGQSFQATVIDTSGGTFPGPRPFDVTVAVQADPNRLPSGVVVEVELPREGSHILFESVEGDVPDVMVFGPDDSYIRTLSGGSQAEMYIEDGLTPGAYVFLPVGHGSFYQLRSGSDIPEGEQLDVQARILDQVILTGGPQAAGDEGSYEVTLDQQPLQTGILVFGGLHGGASIRSAGPEGFVMETSVQGPGFGFGAFTQTPMGHDALRAGTYTISWETPNNDGSVQVQEFFTLYGR
ncbi:MAG: hypothetical protein ACPHID_05000 [Thermoplasmatota archaeon]